MSTHITREVVAHQFDDAAQQLDADKLGMWIFLATEVLFFGGLFTAYAYYRTQFPLPFAAGSQHLDLVLGTINTGVLLTSSFTMALAARSVQTDRRGAAIGLLAATVALGTVFLGIKGYEYWVKFVEHHVPGPNFQFSTPENSGLDSRHVELFFSLYFAMTGLHALHMIIGVGLLSVMCTLVARANTASRCATPVELSGLYWHFVDIVWVFLFPLLYLVR